MKKCEIRQTAFFLALSLCIATTFAQGVRKVDQPYVGPDEIKAAHDGLPLAEPFRAEAPASPLLDTGSAAIQEAAKKQMWSLDSSKTLRDNLDGWVRQSGWNQIIWDASNAYKVRLNTDSIEGEFPEVLKQISIATGLNICATRRDRYVRVTDRGVPCKLNNN